MSRRLCMIAAESITRRKKRVAVLGQGIVGLSCALKAYEEINARGYDYDITVISEKPWQETTTLVSGGINILYITICLIE